MPEIMAGLDIRVFLAFFFFFLVFVFLYGTALNAGIDSAVDRLLLFVVEDEDVAGLTVFLDPLVKLFFGYVLFFSLPGLLNKSL